MQATNVSKCCFDKLFWDGRWIWWVMNISYLVKQKENRKLEFKVGLPIYDESSFVQVRFIKNYFSQEAAQETAETAQENTKKMVLELLRQNQKYTKSDLMSVLAKADGTIKEHIANLKKEGMLKRVDGTKSGHWVFTDE